MAGSKVWSLYPWPLIAGHKATQAPALRSPNAWLRAWCTWPALLCFLKGMLSQRGGRGSEVGFEEGRKGQDASLLREHRFPMNTVLTVRGSGAASSNSSTSGSHFSAHTSLL